MGRHGLAHQAQAQRITIGLPIAHLDRGNDNEDEVGERQDPQEHEPDQDDGQGRADESCQEHRDLEHQLLLSRARGSK